MKKWIKQRLNSCCGYEAMLILVSITLGVYLGVVLL